MLREQRTHEKRFSSFCKVVLMSVLMMLTSSTWASAQVTDSIAVDVFGLPATVDAGVCDDSNFTGRTYVGTSITCELQAFDSEGNPTPASFAVEVDDTTRATVTMVNDSTASIEFLRPGRVWIYVTASPQDILLAMLEEPWDSTQVAFRIEQDGFNMEVGDTTRICGYVVNWAQTVEGAWTYMASGKSHAFCPNSIMPGEPDLPLVSFEFSSNDTTIVKFIEEGAQPARYHPGCCEPPTSIRLASAS